MILLLQIISMILIPRKCVGIYVSHEDGNKFKITIHISLVQVTLRNTTFINQTHFLKAPMNKMSNIIS
jgi:hypothetical protein